jgi:hypothetical protein
MPLFSRRMRQTITVPGRARSRLGFAGSWGFDSVEDVVYRWFPDGAKRCSFVRQDRRCPGTTVATIVSSNSEIESGEGGYGVCEWHVQYLWGEPS